MMEFCSCFYRRWRPFTVVDQNLLTIKTNSFHPKYLLELFEGGFFRIHHVGIDHRSPWSSALAHGEPKAIHSVGFVDKAREEIVSGLLGRFR